MTLHCLNGHEWSAANPAEGSRCPECGQPADLHPTPATLGFDGGIHPTPAFPTIDGYEILAELGRGGMGVVYQARQLRLNRLVALKMVLAGAHASARALARFLSEAKIAAGLQHSNIVQIYELGEHAGRPYLAMEFVTGGGMNEWIARRRGDFPAVAEFFEKLARATDWAHQQSIVHRDLKPANVLIGGDGEPKIGDFGLAKRLDDTDGPKLTLSGEMMGTPDYMAPEQAYPEMGAIGPATDVYALGAMLYQALCGQVPIRGRSEMDWLKRLQHDDPPSPAYMMSGIPRDLETICMKCLCKKPAERYANAGALAEDLRRFRTFQPIVAKPLPVIVKCWRWARRRAGKIAALLLLLTLVVGGGLWWRHEYLYVWETEEYFGEVQRVHGEYRGLGLPLEEVERIHHQSSERLVRAGTRGPLLRMESVDSSHRMRWFPSRSFLIPDLLAKLPSRNQPCQVLLRYNQDGRVSEERLRDRAGQIVVILRYSYPMNFQPGQMSDALRVDILDERGAAVKTATGIEGYQVYRDKNGRDAVVRFINAQEESVPDTMGVYGWKFQWDDRTFLKSMTFLNQSGVATANRDGCMSVDFECDAQGRVTSRTNLDAQGKIVSADGVAMTTTKYDEWGNPIETRNLAPDGQTPARLLSQKFTGRAYHARYDTTGRLSEETLEGANPALAGYSGTKVEYAWKPDGGFVRTTTYFDEKGNAARLRAGGSEAEEEFDSEERLVRFVSVGWNEPEAGFAKMVQTIHWENGDYPRQRITEFFDAQGRPAWNKEGTGRRSEELDEEGRVRHSAFENINPKVDSYFRDRRDQEWAPAENGGQLRGGFVVAAQDLGFNAAGEGQTVRGRRSLPSIDGVMGANGTGQLRHATARFENEQGQLVASKFGNTGFTRDYDANGLKLETHTGFDETKAGFVRQTISFHRNLDGTRAAKWEQFNAAGQKVPNEEGVIENEETSDAEGRMVKSIKIFSDPARKGYAKEEVQTAWSPDKSYSTHSRYFDASGQLTRKAEGYQECAEKFDAEGRVVESSTSGYDEAKAGHARETITIQWNPDNSRTKRWRYENATGQQVLNQDGFRDYEEKFNAEGLYTSIRSSGYPEDKGYDAEVKEYFDWRGGLSHRRVWHYEDRDGKRVRWDQLYFGYVEEFDDKGALKRVTETGYNPNKEPFDSRVADYLPPSTDGLSKAAYTYLDAEGHPQRGPQGELRDERVLRPDQTMVQRHLTGFDEARHGFAECTFDFNAKMVVTRAVFRDGKGQEVPAVQSYICFLMHGGSAETLQLQLGDRIVSYNGIPIANSADFTFNMPPLGGDIEIERDGKKLTIGGVPRGRLGVYLEDRAAK